MLANMASGPKLSAFQIHNSSVMKEHTVLKPRSFPTLLLDLDMVCRIIMATGPGDVERTIGKLPNIKAIARCKE